MTGPASHFKEMPLAAAPRAREGSDIFLVNKYLRWNCAWFPFIYIPPHSEKYDAATLPSP